MTVFRGDLDPMVPTPWRTPAWLDGALIAVLVVMILGSSIAAIRWAESRTAAWAPLPTVVAPYRITLSDGTRAFFDVRTCMWIPARPLEYTGPQADGPAWARSLGNECVALRDRAWPPAALPATPPRWP